MMIKVGWLTILVYLATLGSAVSPPACLLSCVSSVARGAQHPQLKNFPFICYNRIVMNKCLVDKCPFGNYLSARDHFLGTCMEFVEGLDNDPEFNFNMVHPICNQTEAEYILFQYSHLSTINKVNGYPKTYFKALADDDEFDEGDYYDYDEEDDEGDDNGNDKEEGETGNDSDNGESNESDNDSEARYPDRELEGEIEHDYDEEEAHRREDEDEGEDDNEDETESTQPPPESEPSDEYLPPNNDELILEKCSHNLDFYFAEELSRRNAIREYESMEQNRRYLFASNLSVTTKDLHKIHRKLTKAYYSTYFLMHSEKALQRALKIYAKSHNNTISFSPKNTTYEVGSIDVHNSSLFVTGPQDIEVPKQKKQSVFQFEFATHEQILNHKPENDHSSKESVDMQAKAKKKNKHQSSRPKKATTFANRNKKTRQRQNLKVAKSQAQRKAKINRQKASNPYSNQKVSDDKNDQKKKKIQFSSSFFNSKLDHAKDIE